MNWIHPTKESVASIQSTAIRHAADMAGVWIDPYSMKRPSPGLRIAEEDYRCKKIARLREPDIPDSSFGHDSAGICYQLVRVMVESGV